jgi:ATPase subunit of ABC transporter with duplicated ATPase domains
MLEVKDLTITLLDDRPLVKDLSFVINNNDKVAIVGEEGNGKSTLLKAIYNINLINNYAKVTGIINKNNIKIGYLPQFLDSNWNNEIVINFFTKKYYNSNINYDIYNQINEIIKILAKFDLKDNILEQTIHTLSGGEKIKINLAKILFEGYDLLLLDEPTNDLDIESLEFLEDFIINSKEPIIFISHDETLLEKTANSILHMEQIKNKSDARNTFERITYSEYVEKRKRALNKQTQMAVSEQKEYLEAKQIISRQKSAVRTAQIKIKDAAVRNSLNKKMKNIIFQQDRLENKERTQKPDVEDAIYFSFDNIYIPNNKIILDLYLKELKIDNKILSKDIKLTIKGNDKIVITGKNGCGKTTLLNIIYNTLKDNKSISLGYMPQNYDPELNINQTALDYLKAQTLLDETTIRAYMGNMKFTSDEMLNQIKDLSGGQKAKLILLKLILNKNNVLILDEPTRNLSPLSNPVIRQMLKEYQGCIISVSHDRKYINEVCNTHYILNEKGIK